MDRDETPRPRSVLFVPGNRSDMLAKAARYDAGGFMPDLEDSVPETEKASARATVGEALEVLVDTGRPVIPRVNSLQTGLVDRDLEAVVRPGIAGVSLGKVRSAADIELISRLLSAAESASRIEAGSIGLLPWLETPQAILDAHAICAASSRIRWVAFGADDYSMEMEIPRRVDESDPGAADPASSEPALVWARSAVAVAAAALGAHALDTPYTLYEDDAGLEAEARLARKLGYQGKFAIHPAQLDTINRVFRPTELEIERARRIVAAATAGETSGRGAVSVDGEMIDAPVVERARRLLRESGLDH